VLVDGLVAGGLAGGGGDCARLPEKSDHAAAATTAAMTIRIKTRAFFMWRSPSAQKYNQSSEFGAWMLPRTALLRLPSAMAIKWGHSLTSRLWPISSVFAIYTGARPYLCLVLHGPGIGHQHERPRQSQLRQDERYR
jgi:hypothetical protein